MHAIFLNSKNSKTSNFYNFNKLKKRVIDALLSMHYTWKNILKTFNKTSLKYQLQLEMNEKLPGGSCSLSDIQDYSQYITKKHETETNVNKTKKQD